MKKALRYVIFISGTILGVSVGMLLFLTGEDLAPKIKAVWSKLSKKGRNEP